MKASNPFRRTRALPFLLVGLLLAAPAAPAAAAIYRWTDSSGVIHYSQTPPPAGQGHNLVRLPESGSDAPAATPADANGAAGAKAGAAKKQPDAGSRKAAAKPKKAPAKPPETAEQRAERCRKARRTLTLVQTHTRIRVHEADGRTERMTEEQRQARIKSLEKMLAKDCS